MGNLPLDLEVVDQKFRELARKVTSVTGDRRSPEAVAEGFLEIAVENMALAIEECGTIIVEPDWSAGLMERGEIIMEGRRIYGPPG